MEENWKPIPGFPLYEASDQGRIRSVDRTVNSNGRGTYLKKGCVLSSFEQQGYRRVLLHKEGKPTAQLVHRLVYMAFHGPCEGMQVRHWPDRDRSHNTPDNLQIGTNSDNQRDSVAHGTHNMASKTSCKRGHPFDEANTYWLPSGAGRMCKACRQ